jgi:hypothetical protein
LVVVEEQVTCRGPMILVIVKVRRVVC